MTLILILKDYIFVLTDDGDGIHLQGCIRPLSPHFEGAPEIIYDVFIEHSEDTIIHNKLIPPEGHCWDKGIDRLGNTLIDCIELVNKELECPTLDKGEHDG